MDHFTAFAFALVAWATPPTWMEQQQHDPRVAEEGWSYTKFVSENPTAARTLESLLQYSGFFAPVSFLLPRECRRTAAADRRWLDAVHEHRLRYSSVMQSGCMFFLSACWNSRRQTNDCHTTFFVGCSSQYIIDRREVIAVCRGCCTTLSTRLLLQYVCNICIPWPSSCPF